MAASLIGGTSHFELSALYEPTRVASRSHSLQSVALLPAFTWLTCYPSQVAHSWPLPELTQINKCLLADWLNRDHLKGTIFSVWLAIEGIYSSKSKQIQERWSFFHSHLGCNFVPIEARTLLFKLNLSHLSKPNNTDLQVWRLLGVGGKEEEEETLAKFFHLSLTCCCCCSLIVGSCLDSWVSQVFLVIVLV